MSKTNKNPEEKQSISAGNLVSKVAAKAKGAVATVKNSTLDALDQNKDGQVDVFDIIILAMKTPGVRIHRDEFLKKELFKNHPQEIIEKAIATTPAKAGITKEEVDSWRMTRSNLNVSVSPAFLLRSVHLVDGRWPQLFLRISFNTMGIL